jgi:hypothetical protein
MSVRALLSTVGSRGEAQPMLALAVQFRELGHDAVVLRTTRLSIVGRVARRGLRAGRAGVA